MVALLPLLVASAVARRFASRRVELTVAPASLSIGPRATAPVDVWQDELRVTVAADGDVFALTFDDADVAARFVGALPPSQKRVAGHRPRPVDALPALRFLAVAIAFLATGSWLGAIALLPFARGARALWSARQVAVDDTRIVLAGIAGERIVPLADVRDVDGEHLVLTSGERLAVDVRDALLEAPPWMARARARVLG